MSLHLSLSLGLGSAALGGSAAYPAGALAFHADDRTKLYTERSSPSTLSEVGNPVGSIVSHDNALTLSAPSDSQRPTRTADGVQSFTDTVLEASVDKPNGGFFLAVCVDAPSGNDESVFGIALADPSTTATDDQHISALYVTRTSAGELEIRGLNRFKAEFEPRVFLPSNSGPFVLGLLVLDDFSGHLYVDGKLVGGIYHTDGVFDFDDYGATLKLSLFALRDSTPSYSASGAVIRSGVYLPRPPSDDAEIAQIMTLMRGRHSVDTLPRGDHFTAAGGSQQPWYGGAIHPHVVYDETSDQVFVAFGKMNVGDATLRGAAMSYNLTSGGWQGPVEAAVSKETIDDHGNPAIIVDNLGHLHMIGGGHNTTDHYHVVSTRPRGITAWTTLPDIVGSFTYPQPRMVGDRMYLFFRGHETKSNPSRYLTLFVSDPITTGGALTWQDPIELFDFGTDSRVYQYAHPEPQGTKIYLVCCRANGADTVRSDVYVAVYDTADGSLSSLDGGTTFTAAQLPAGDISASSAFKVVDQGDNPSVEAGAIGAAVFDGSGNLHIVYPEGAYSGDLTLFHRVWDGSSWSSKTNVGSTSSRYSPPALDSRSGGTLDLYYMRDGNIYQRTMSAAGAWGSETEVATPEGDFDLDQVSVVYGANAPDGVRVAWTEVSSFNWSVGALSGFRLYAYGDSGFV